MQFETNRLLIREFRSEDVQRVHEYASDPAVAKYMIWGPNSLEDTRSYIRLTLDMQQQEPRQGFEYAVVLKQGNVLIGGCGIHISGEGQGRSATAITAPIGVRVLQVRLPPCCWNGASMTLIFTGSTRPAARRIPALPESCNE